jgi:hypothetical protein
MADDDRKNAPGSLLSTMPSKRFEDHLRKASEIVSRWPAWKQQILGGLTQTAPKQMPKKSNWLKHDIRVAALIYQAINHTSSYSDENIARQVNSLFPRARVGIGRIRHGRLLLQRLGILKYDGKTIGGWSTYSWCPPQLQAR